MHRYGNVFFNVYRSILLGGGRDYTIENNVFIDSISSTFTYFIIIITSFIIILIFDFVDNIYIDGRGLEPSINNSVTLLQRYRDMPTQTPPWSEQYPTLVNLLDGKKREKNITKMRGWNRRRGDGESESKRFGENRVVIIIIVPDNPFAPKYNYVRRNLKIGTKALTTISTVAKPYPLLLFLLFLLFPLSLFFSFSFSFSTLLSFHSKKMTQIDMWTLT